MATYRTALVTGASSGIGECFSRRLAAAGSDLVVVARRTDRLAALARELRAAYDVEIEVLGADLLDLPALAAVEQRLSDADRPVDLLVNNAGFGTSGPFAELPVQHEDEEVRLNVLALVRLTRAALPGMIERGHGGVLNVSSMAGFQPAAFRATYAATKAFVTSFTEALAGELRGTGVSATALCPGFTHTEFHQTNDFFPVDRVPGPFWLAAGDVVDAGLRAVENGRPLSIPGGQYRALATLSRLAPRSLVRAVTGRVR